LSMEQRSQPPGANHADEPAPAARPQGLGNVLVVDDAPVNMELLRGILEPSGYMVCSADTVAEALALARQSLPDVVISDLMMHPDTGYDFLRQLKADPALSTVPVIIHSASNADRKSQSLALSLGAARFVPRPIEPEALLTIIESCLREARGG